MENVLLGTIYGPVGRVIQRKGEAPKVVLHERWEEIAQELNGVIQTRATVPGSDRLGHNVAAEIEKGDLNSLAELLADMSEGELSLVERQARPRETP